MALDLMCAYCLLKNSISSNKPAVTLLNGTALCQNHLGEYNSENRARR
jgi:hypothetical protein